MKRIRISRHAERDLDEIWIYVATNSQSVGIANRVIDNLVARVSVLARFPEAGSRRDSIEPGLRGLSAGSYVLYYKIGRNIVISRVIHGMRDQRLACLQ